MSNIVTSDVLNEARRDEPAATALSGVKIFRKLPEANIEDWKRNNPGKQSQRGGNQT